MKVPGIDPQVFLFLSGLQFPLLLLDSHEAILWMNPPLEDLIQQKLPAVLGKHVDGVVIFQESQAFPSLDEPMGSRIHKGWGTLVRPDGSFAQVAKIEETHGKTSTSPGYTIIGYIENHQEQDYVKVLEVDREAALEAARAKNTFLANLSHELRTPLNSILGMSDLALDLAQSPEQVEYLTILKVGAESLFQLIASLLDYVKLENNKAKLQVQTFKLIDFIHDTLATVAVHCHTKGLGLYLEIDPLVPDVVIGDMVRLRQVLINILNNAIKFTDLGHVSLRVSIHPEQGDLGSYQIRCKWAVHDSGIGIHEENLKRVFEPFTQIDGSSTRSAGGTGIGLSIVRHLVELMGGTISVESELGKGSTFTFTTVFELENHFKFLSNQHHSKELKGQTIVLCSDSDPWIQSIAGIAATCEPDLRIVKSLGELASTMATLEVVPLVIFHGYFTEASMLPHHNHAPWFHQLQRRKHLVTTRLQRLEERTWMGSGFLYETINEPIRAGTLLSMVKILVAEWNRQKEMVVVDQYVPKQKLSILYAEDDIVSATLYREILEQAGHHVHHVTDGQQAVDCLRVVVPDIVILDIEMPILNGYELTTLIRNGGMGLDYTTLPIVALTAMGGEMGTNHGEALGINAFLSKPFFPHSLLATIDRVVELAFQQRQSNDLSLEILDLEKRIRLTGLTPKDTSILKGQIANNHVEIVEHLLQEARSWFTIKDQARSASMVLSILFKLRRRDMTGALKGLEELELTLGEIS